MRIWKAAWRGMGWWRWLCLGILVVWLAVFSARLVLDIGV